MIANVFYTYYRHFSRLTMHFSPPFYILVAAATVFCLVTGATVPRWCSSKKPEGSKCQGCPPMFGGKPCASTTRYNGRKWGDGSCACKDSWTKSKYTAAANAVFMNPLRKRVTAASAVDFCQENCGQCYRICTTGGSHFSHQLAQRGKRVHRDPTREHVSAGRQCRLSADNVA